MTPTLNDERGVGSESPAELFPEPCGTFRAESIFPSLWSGLKELPKPLESSREVLRVKDCFALLKKVAALLTVLLRRVFLSPAGPGSSLLTLRLKNPVGGDNFLDDTVESSGVTASDDEVLDEEGSGVSILFECGTMESDLSLGGLEEPLNILFSNPPWFEPRRLFPASLKVGEGVGYVYKSKGNSSRRESQEGDISRLEWLVYRSSSSSSRRGL